MDAAFISKAEQKLPLKSIPYFARKREIECLILQIGQRKFRGESQIPAYCGNGIFYRKRTISDFGFHQDYFHGLPRIILKEPPSHFQAPWPVLEHREKGSMRYTTHPIWPT